MNNYTQIYGENRCKTISEAWVASLKWLVVRLCLVVGIVVWGGGDNMNNVFGECPSDCPSGISIDISDIAYSSGSDSDHNLPFNSECQKVKERIMSAYSSFFGDNNVYVDAISEPEFIVKENGTESVFHCYDLTLKKFKECESIQVTFQV